MSNQQSKKSKKAGRNAVRCKVYRLSNTREKNKLRRLLKRIERHPLDKVAVAAAETCRKAIRGY